MAHLEPDKKVLGFMALPLSTTEAPSSKKGETRKKGNGEKAPLRTLYIISLCSVSYLSPLKHKKVLCEGKSCPIGKQTQ